MKTTLNLNMSAETRKKISNSKLEYHIKINKLLLLVDEIVKLQQDNKTNNSNTKNK